MVLLVMAMWQRYGRAAQGLASEQLLCLHYKVRGSNGGGGNGSGNLIRFGAALECVLKGNPVLGGATLWSQCNASVQCATRWHVPVYGWRNGVRVGDNVLELAVVEHAHIYVLYGADLQEIQRGREIWS